MALRNVLYCLSTGASDRNLALFQFVCLVTDLWFNWQKFSWVSQRKKENKWCQCAPHNESESTKEQREGKGKTKKVIVSQIFFWSRVKCIWGKEETYNYRIFGYTAIYCTYYNIASFALEFIASPLTRWGQTYFMKFPTSPQLVCAYVALNTPFDLEL